jgi:hypothetical protein
MPSKNSSYTGHMTTVSITNWWERLIGNSVKCFCSDWIKEFKDCFWEKEYVRKKWRDEKSVIQEEAE